MANEIARFNERELLSDITLTIHIVRPFTHRIGIAIGMLLIRAGCLLSGLGFKVENERSS